MIGKTFTLLNDVPNRLNKGTFYAKKGDKVKVYREVGNILFVEMNGNKFSIFKDDVKND